MKIRKFPESAKKVVYGFQGPPKCVWGMWGASKPFLPISNNFEKIRFFLKKSQKSGLRKVLTIFYAKATFFVWVWAVVKAYVKAYATV